MVTDKDEYLFVIVTFDIFFGIIILILYNIFLKLSLEIIVFLFQKIKMSQLRQLPENVDFNSPEDALLYYSFLNDNGSVIDDIGNYTMPIYCWLLLKRSFIQTNLNYKTRY